VYPRAEAACSALRDQAFGIPIETDATAAEMVADSLTIHIMRAIESPAGRIT
jgi:hypothetical protein